MVMEQIISRGITNESVITALEEIPRHEFVPREYFKNAYDDRPLPIGYGQTISQPYIVAYMTDIIEPKNTDRVLEIGTGSGYQAAVLSKIVKEVFTIEIVEQLGLEARQTLERLGYSNIEVKIGDGYNGWPEKAPFDGIIVTAAAEYIPQPLLDQLKEGEEYMLKLDEVVRKIYAGDEPEPLHFCRKSIEKLGLPPFLANPIVDKAFRSHF